MPNSTGLYYWQSLHLNGDNALIKQLIWMVSGASGFCFGFGKRDCNLLRMLQGNLLTGRC